MLRVIRSIRVLKHKLIEISWSDDDVSIVDFTPIIAQGGEFAPMSDALFFEQASVDERGRVVNWPGDLEFCADALFEMSRVPATR